MRTRFLPLVAAASLAFVAGCPAKKDDNTLNTGGGSVSVTAAKTTVVANGTNTVTLTITNTTGSDATLSTTQGTLSATTVVGASGTVTLTTCTFGAAGCTSTTTTVIATAGGKSGSASITFGSAVTLCAADCTIDSACGGLACTAVAGGTCGGTWPALSCAATGGGGTGGTQVLGSLALPTPPVEYTVLGASGSGWQESGWVQVQALDQQGNPMPAGTTVHFEHRQLGGSTFANAIACSPAAAGCVGYDATTDADGLATAWLVSGTEAGTLLVTATATVSSVTRSVSLPAVAVVGAKANGANFSIECSPRNVPALNETNCSWSHVDAPYTCVALAKDRYNNLLGRATQVIFASEAAAVGQIATTPAYDPASDPVTQKDLGSAVQIFQTLGGGLPRDVAPATGEPSVTVGTALAPDACPTNVDGFSRTHNPRDGAVTVIAVADGEEAFFDSDGDGAYTTGHPFVDQGEPFIDADDDGVWDDGTTGGAREWFLDLNGNKAWDGPNDAWDANTKIWTQAVVLFTGHPTTIPAGGGNLLGTRWADVGQVACTASPPATPFAVLAKVTGPPDFPPTSTSRLVFASDENLNFLPTGTTYDVTVELPGKVITTYSGFDKYADLQGFSYRYWPCDQSGACSSQCLATGANNPCTMVPLLSGYGCGLSATVRITGGDTADGTNYVDWTVVTPYSRYGGLGVDWTRVEVLSGTNN